MQYIEIRCFSGYIRNWKKLCGELDIDPTLSRAEREEALLIAAYHKWQMKMMEHLYGMGTTLIMIAHRLETIAQCDQIYVIEHGRITQHGTHDELRQTDGLYSKLLNFA